MKSFTFTAALVAFVGSLAGAETAKIAPKPPMGWNSFDSYGVYLHEKAAMENLEAMAKHWKPYGYCWWMAYSRSMENSYHADSFRNLSIAPDWKFADAAVLTEYTDLGGAGVPDCNTTHQRD